MKTKLIPFCEIWFRFSVVAAVLGIPYDMLMIGDQKHKKALSTTLKALRGKRTQKEMAAEAGIPTSTWCKIEQGVQMPRYDNFERMATVFGMSPEDLYLMVLHNLLSEASGEGVRRWLPSAGVVKDAFKFQDSVLGQIENVRSQLDGITDKVKHHVRTITKPDGGLENDAESDE